MTLQNQKDFCKAIVKELILQYEGEDMFNNWNDTTLKKTIEFIKSRKTQTSELIEVLTYNNYLVLGDNGLYSLGSRAKKLTSGWVVD